MTAVSNVYSLRLTMLIKRWRSVVLAVDITLNLFQILLRNSLCRFRVAYLCDRGNGTANKICCVHQLESVNISYA
jgi:hypothetical protein